MSAFGCTSGEEEVVGEGLVDAVCVGCGKGVGLGEPFVSPGTGKPFHRGCFSCGACRTPLLHRPFHFQPDGNRLRCRECAERIAVSAEATVAESRGISRVQCEACGEEQREWVLALGTTGEEGLWCRSCARCANCGLSVEVGGGGVFRVTDELYCLRCPDAARLRAYDLARLGAGPAQPALRPTNLPRHPAPNKDSSLSAFLP